MGRASHCLATAAAQTSTGERRDWKLCEEQGYLKTNYYSFYEAEVTLANHRLQQPSNKRMLRRRQMRSGNAMRKFVDFVE
ncbi:unnamed protein product [Heligmosomoides polygyrus]|uniref:NADH dehydrogenase [ubiquinone] flavoprotein 3, mitochondrial n=1 Tax=Heligmosomoides polygyrus TaxID=6339 RepID=A0A183G4G4_HELPZ|nr:unnamed protein product [Heligmosomoides polygyrus]